MDLKKSLYIICFIAFNFSYAQKNHLLKVFFEKDKSQLLENSKFKIDSINNLLKIPSDFFIKLDAHTDSDGTDKYNYNLSSKRANSVKDELLRLKFPTENIEISSFGESIPEVDNSSKENMRKNRRVRIIYVDRTGKVRIKGKILSDDEKNPLTKVRILIKTENKIDTVYTNTLGEYDVWVPKSNPTYYLISRVKNHFYHYEKINTNSETQIEKNIELKKLTKGALLNIPLFNFIAEEDILVKESEPNLRLLLETMRQNPNLKIEIHGHINKQKSGNVSVESSSFKLSVRRAKFVYNFLVKNGIDPKRMQTKAFGNWKMLYPETDDLNLQNLNRRVEIYVIQN